MCGISLPAAKGGGRGMGTPAPAAPRSCRAEAARSWLRFLLGALEDALGGHHHSEPSQTPAGGTGWPSAHLGLLLLLSSHSTPAGCTAPSRSCPNIHAQPVPSRRTQAPRSGGSGEGSTRRRSLLGERLLLPYPSP